MSSSVVFLEDCMQVMARYPDKYFDLAVVDPPYGIGVHKMNYTKSGPRIEGRKTQARRRDYRNTGEWDTKPGTEYFAELQRVSKRQIIWGAITFPICCRRRRASSCGINAAARKCQTTLPTASWHGSAPGSAWRVYFVMCGMECYKAICETRKNASTRRRSRRRFMNGC